MSNADFETNEVQFYTSEDGKLIRMVFSRPDGEKRSIVLEQRNLASLIAGAQKMLPRQDAVPIDRSSLKSGTSIRVVGHQFEPRESELGLTLFVDLPEQDRGVTIPLHFSRDDAESVVRQIQAWLVRTPKANG